MKKICYCGHELKRHMYNEPPIGGWSPGDLEPVLEFTHCAGMAPHGDEKQVCACKAYQAFPLGTYRHLKTGNLYEVTDLGFNSEDRTVEVEYVSLSHGERWHRPLYTPNTGSTKMRGFLEADAATGRPRFEYMPCSCSPGFGRGFLVHADSCPQRPHVEDVNRMTVDVLAERS